MCFPSLSWNKKREESFPESLCFFALSQEKDRWLGGTLHPLRSNLSRQVVHTVFLLITRTCEGNFFINEDTFLWFISWVSSCFVKWLFLQSLRYTVVEFKIYLIFILIIIIVFAVIVIIIIIIVITIIIYKPHCLLWFFLVHPWQPCVQMPV